MHQHAGRNTEAATVMNYYYFFFFFGDGGILPSVVDANFLRL